MPLYDFKCTKCDKVFEEHQSFTEPHPISCPDCKAAAERIPTFGGSTFVLKGSGWTGKINPKK